MLRNSPQWQRPLLRGGYITPPEVPVARPTEYLVEARGDGRSVRVPVSPDGLVTVSDGPTSVSINLPQGIDLERGIVTNDGTIVYPASGSGVAVTLQAFEDGSARIRTVIPDLDAPDRYRYDLSLPEGASVVPEEDGALAIIDAEGALMAGIAPPWAVDAEGNELPTAYEIRGTSIVQRIDLGAARAFPVIADPYLGIRLIDSVTRSYYWLFTDGGGVKGHS